MIASRKTRIKKYELPKVETTTAPSQKEINAISQEDAQKVYDEFIADTSECNEFDGMTEDEMTSHYLSEVINY